MIVLGIESSCDDTAVSIVKDGSTILSSVVSSQTQTHHPYGGVVPELASRKHMEAIFPVFEEAVKKAGENGIDGVSATQGPGLIGSLLVGFSFAKAYAYARNLPFIGVSHLKSHINSVFLTDDPPPFPFTAMLVSGGHTAIYDVAGHKEMKLMGQTRDDAAGEAFDKAAKLMGLGYPGGVVMGRLADEGKKRDIDFPRTFLDRDQFDFSFSGIKTAVLRYLQTHENWRDEIEDIAYAFQEAVTDVLSFKLIHAAEKRKVSHIALTGGVAANKRLREKTREAAEKKGMKLHVPPISLCGDNAAMIAALGYHYLKDGETSPLDADVYSRETFD